MFLLPLLLSFLSFFAFVLHFFCIVFLFFLLFDVLLFFGVAFLIYIFVTFFEENIFHCFIGSGWKRLP